MIVYENTKKGFIEDVLKGRYVQVIENNLKVRMNRKVGQSEKRSWQNSLRAMKDIIQDDAIPKDVGIAIEYNIPNTSKRVDFIISGYNKNKEEELLFIELKQWESIKKIEGMDQVVETFIGGGIRQLTHPSYQVYSYVELLKNSNEYIQKKNMDLYSCAYLHNYFPQNKDPILDICYKEYLKKAPVFRMTEADKLQEYIKKHIKYGDKLLSLKAIEKGNLKPSKSLQDCLISLLNNNPEFMMIDDQKVIYENILLNLRKSQKDKKKRVVIIEGGPGTGKTVIAINLLVKAINENIYASYVTKNTAPRAVFSAKLVGSDFSKSHIKGLFMSSGSFTSCEKNKFGFLICDEAHRLNDKSGLFSNMGENQIKEIINASLSSCFFIDEDQIVHAKDIGRIEEIKRWARKENAICESYKLVSQFRCGGSDGYLSWLDNVLEIKETANTTFDEVFYDFRVVDSPKELEKLIRKKNKKDNKSRMLAGYCWPWISKKNEKRDLYDIQIDDFKMQWNLDVKKPFAIDEGSINQVGCIHTAQGLEFTYVGLIIGDDLRYENDTVITDYSKRAKTDKSIVGLKGPAKDGDKESLAKLDKIIRNTYKTLMSRGLKGCYIYCTDSNLQNYFKTAMKDFCCKKVAEKTIEYKS